MTAEPRTEAGRVVVMQLVADGVVTREAAETWVAAIEAEAAQQGVDGAALSLGLTIDGSKMSKAYIEKALARVEETWRAALPVPALDALREALELIFAADRMTSRKKPLAMRAALDEARRVYLAALREGETPNE